MRHTRPLLYSTLCLAAASADPCAPEPDDSPQTPYYAPTTWASVHGDSSNSDRVGIVAPEAVEVAWTALDGAAVLLAPTVAPDGRRYVTTGQGFGTSHLHAFDRDGTLLWESPTFTAGGDLGPWAVLSAPLVDCDGDVYVSDSNQFFAFRPDGSVKWVASLAAQGATNGFISSLLTDDGLVGGITTDGLVILFERGNGSLARPVLELPGGDGPLGPLLTPAGLWAAGLLDPARVADVYFAFTGSRVEVANTPAVHPATGRIYITAAGATPSEGRLYGIDVGAFQLSIAFTTPIGAGSGSSPAIAPDGSAVYAAGGDGTMYAVDAASGQLLWSTPGLGAAASPGVGADGTIYSGSGNGPDGVLTALFPDGAVRWSVGYDDLAAQHLLPRPESFPLFPDGAPHAKVNSVVTSAVDELWVAIAVGYDVVPLIGAPVHQPYLTFLARVDPADGSLLATVPLRDVSEGVISISPEGDVYVSHAAIQSSSFYYGLNPIVGRAYRVPGPPTAGLTALAPVSSRAHALAGLAWASELGSEAHTILAARGSAVADASDSLRAASFQSDAVLLAVDDAVERDELDALVGGLAQNLVESARDRLRDARQELEDGGSEAAADAEIEDALTELDQARDLLD